MNPLVHLGEFLSRANRYTTLLLKNSETSLYRKKIVVIKDLPAMVYANLNEWHGMIRFYLYFLLLGSKYYLFFNFRNYNSKGKTPIVFIVTEGNTNYGASMKLFPTSLLEKLSMSTIRYLLL